jgi:hypothetical protein
MVSFGSNRRATQISPSRYGYCEDASRPMAIADRDFRRDGLFTTRARLPTAGRKGAAGRQLGKVGWGTGDRHKAFVLAERAIGTGRQQTLGVGMRRRPHHAAAVSDLDDAPRIHDSDAVGDV